MAESPEDKTVAQGLGTVGADGEVTGRGWRSLWFVLIVQAQNAFNDKVAQYVLLAVSLFAFAGSEFADDYKSIVGFLLTIPFILFAPLAGWIADRYSKRSVMMWCLYAQLVILFCISVSLYFGSIWTATGGFFLLAIQSAFFSPAKYGILKEIVGTRKLAVASGWAQMLVMVGIIAGTALGGLALREFMGRFDIEDWRVAAFFAINIIGVLSIGAIFAGLAIVKTPSGTSAPLHRGVLMEHFVHLKDLLKERSLRLTALGISYFWFAGVLVTMIVIEVANAGVDMSGDAGKGEAGARAGVVSAYIGIGIALGSMLVSAISWRRNELGIIPIGGFGMAVSGIVAGFVPMDSGWFDLTMGLIGFFAGFFFVPLNALLQELAPPDRRGRVLSASGLLDSLAILLGIGLQLVMSKLGLDPQWQFVVMGILTFIASIYVLRILPQNFVRFMVVSLARLAYRIRGINVDNIPHTGGALLVGNHLSYVDAFMIGAASYRPIRFVIFDHYYKVWWMRWFLKMVGAVPISATRAKDAVRTVARAVKEGDLVCIFPEGQLSRTGALNEFKKGFELMARQSKSPVIPVYMDGLWGSIFSFERNKFIFKIPHRVPYRVSVAFGPPLAEDEMTADGAKRAVMRMSAEAVAARIAVRCSPKEFLLTSLKGRAWKPCLIDVSRKRRVMRRSSVWAASVALGSKWEKEIEGKRVAVLLPPGTSAVLANLGLWMAGKVPVNLPFALAEQPDAAARLFKEHGIGAMVSSSMIRERIPDFPWPGNFTDMLVAMKELNGTTIFWETIRGFFEPVFWTRRRLGLEKENENEKEYEKQSANSSQADGGSMEAACSVSLRDKKEGDSTEGGPGYDLVAHSSAKLLANSAMLGSVNGIVKGVTIINGYTLDTIPGLVIGICHGLAERTAVIHLPLTLDSEKLGRLLGKGGDVQMIGEPGLFKGLTAVPYEVSGKNLQRLFTFGKPAGDEDLAAVEAAIKERYHLLIYRGMVLKRAGSIISLNLPDPKAATATARFQPGHREGSEGRLFPGMGAEMCDPATGEALPLHSEVPGDLTLTGTAVCAEGSSGGTVIHHCRLDAEGFLFIGENPEKQPSEPAPSGESEES